LAAVEGAGVFAGEELVGTISIIMFARDCPAIRKMFVKKQFMGSGLNVAALLLEELTNFAQENEITSLYLGTIELPVEKQGLPNLFPRMDSDNLFFKKNI
jgi:hypothetical protein